MTATADDNGNNQCNNGKKWLKQHSGSVLAESIFGARTWLGLLVRVNWDCQRVLSR